MVSSILIALVGIGNGSDNFQVLRQEQWGLVRGGKTSRQHHDEVDWLQQDQEQLSLHLQSLASDLFESIRIYLLLQLWECIIEPSEQIYMHAQGQLSATLKH